MDLRRKSGVLLHPTSLPGPGGIGCFGREAREFIDFLAASGQSIWQVLPLNPAGYGNSPYSCYSAFAGNPLLIDLAPLVEHGWLSLKDSAEDFPTDWVDFQRVIPHKLGCLRKAAGNFMAAATDDRKRDFWWFCDSTPWLHDYALFMALKEHFKGVSWNKWPLDIAQREPSALDQYSRDLGVSIGEHKFMQWQFYRQWVTLRSYAADKGVKVFGDLPIFVAYDSADVWSNRNLFLLDKDGIPFVVAGVPPDYFSKTGQRWGNPLYDWPAHESRSFSWWVERMRASLVLYDIVRIDHFRGFEAYWEIPASSKTAVNGKWVKGPGDRLFSALEGNLGQIPLVAEDLGVITQEVESLRDRWELPGMKILQFAFGSGPDNPYLPHNHRRRAVVYTGTHDNDTSVGWFSTLSPKEKKNVLTYLDASEEEMPWPVIRAALASVAAISIVPLQDLAGLGSDARMNLPGTSRGNWEWRCSREMMTADLAVKLSNMTKMFGRIT